MSARERPGLCARAHNLSSRDDNSSAPRSIFVVTVEATIRQLRWWMKRAGRGYGVRVIDLREAENQIDNINLKSRGRQ